MFNINTALLLQVKDFLRRLVKWKRLSQQQIKETRLVEGGLKQNMIV